MSHEERLPKPHLRLAIANAIVDKIPLDEVVNKLWREDPEEVATIYRSVCDNHADERYQLRSYLRRTEKRLKRKLLTRHRRGLTLNEIAKKKRMKVATLVALLEHHGLLELVQFGLDQKRRMVTDQAFHAELGHNVYPTNRIGHLEGHGKAAPFPVFYPERLGEIMWMLDMSGTRRGVIKFEGKKEKLAWLLKHHAYLPDGEIASLAGYSRRAVITGRPRTTQKPPKALPNAA